METIKRGSLKIRADFSRPESLVQYAIVDDNIDQKWCGTPYQVADLSWPKRPAAIKAVNRFLKDNAPG